MPLVVLIRFINLMAARERAKQGLCGASQYEKGSFWLFWTLNKKDRDYGREALYNPEAA